MQRSNLKKVDSTFTLNTKRINPPSELTKDVRAEIRLLALSDLKPYRYQARKSFHEEEIKALADTIETHGIRSPLTVLFDEENDVYEIVSGERRFRAAQLLNLERIPCIILKDAEAAQEIALIENVQRKDLHPVELFEGIEQYVTRNPHVSKETLYSRLGISKAYFYKLLKLSRLTPEVRKIAIENKISGEELYSLADVPSDNQQAFINKPKGYVGASTTLDRAMNKKCKVLQISMKDNQLSVDTNLFVLSELKKAEAIMLLKNLIEQIERELKESR